MRPFSGLSLSFQSLAAVQSSRRMMSASFAETSGAPVNIAADKARPAMLAMRARRVSWAIDELLLVE
jgi:hypothetical protein